MRIIIAGSIAYDYLMSFPGKFSDHFLADKLDQISVSFLVDQLRKERGGVAANIAYSLGLLGERPLLVGAVGDDFGPYQKQLESSGVDTSGVRVFQDEFTSSCFINTDNVENQIVAFYTGAMRHSSQLSLKEYFEKGVDLVVVSPGDPDAMIAFCRECREHDVPFLFDPSQQIVALSGESLREGTRGAKLLVVNEYELEMFCRKAELKEDDLLTLAETVIITLGSRGSDIRTGERTIKIPVVSPETVVDPTGVGDAYRSGLIKGMVHGLSWETSGRMGSLAASYVLEHGGTQQHAYDLEMFASRYYEVFGESEDVKGLLRK